MTKDEQQIESARQLLISAYTDAIEVAITAEHKAALAWGKLQLFNGKHPHQTKTY